VNEQEQRWARASAGGSAGNATVAERVISPHGAAPLMGIDFDLLTEGETIAHLLASLDAGIGGWLMNPNVDVLRQLVAHDELAALARQADLLIADGKPLVWALRAQGVPLADRVAGSSLIWTLSEAAAGAGRSVFLLGGAPGVADRAAAALVAASPGLRIAGTHCPPLGFEHDTGEMARIVDVLTDADPDIVFCGFGFPKQERLIVRLREVLPRPWLVATGASIAMAAGEFTRAPRWMQESGLEWLYRLGQEPRRLFKRYVVHDLPFAVRLAAHAVGRRWRQRGAPAAGAGDGSGR
jgi:N-acetylglucosaminyldiphosphoundecaprenol N-acetyl-beta-D-mannosaminyltransferase